MSLRWTNELEIIRDLHEAQGAFYFNIHKTVCKEKDPLHLSSIKPNKMDVSHCCDDFEFKSVPDLKLIKEMLDMVRQTNTSPDIVSVNPGRMLKICKIDPLQKIDNKIIIDEVKVPKTKKQRNVALASILEAISTRDSMNVDETDENAHIASLQKTEPHMKLLKPEDFIINDESDEYMESVYSIINHSSPNVANTMFKNNHIKTKMNTFDSYKPSFMADLYYKKYLERSKLKSMHHHFMYETEQLFNIGNLKEPNVFYLPQHRHMLYEECIVCKLHCQSKSAA